MYWFDFVSSCRWAYLPQAEGPFPPGGNARGPAGPAPPSLSSFAAKTTRAGLIGDADAFFSAGWILPHGINLIHILRNLRRIILGQIGIHRRPKLILPRPDGQLIPLLFEETPLERC